mmetsp:Transcript_14346/g.12643  ORF Transcript_14346/g.12643 Transcript_14346/m.12643 type:complete len:190 (-) Transcript_14346:273-842(-)
MTNNKLYKDKSLNLLRILNQRHILFPTNEDVQCSFKPRVHIYSKGNKSVRNVKGRRHFGERLHREHTLSSLERSRSRTNESQREFDCFDRRMNYSPTTNKESKKYYSDLKNKIFKMIFDRLDQDGSGKLDKGNLNLKTIDFDTINTLSPVLAEIEEAIEPVSKKIFVKRCSQLYSKLNPKQRQVLLKYK